MMQRGLQFRILSPKDIASLLTMIGVHPVVTADVIEKPTPEAAMSAFLGLAEFAFDMDPQQLKTQVGARDAGSEIYNDVLDQVTVFKLIKQLCSINNFEDFSLRDIWAPDPKRFRTVLSGIINFCRYKEVQSVEISTMKESLAAQDGVKLELVDRSNQLEVELAAAQEQHSSEVQAHWLAEGAAGELRGALERLRRQRQAADRVVEETEAKLAAAKQREVQVVEDVARHRERTEVLQDQVAESAKGLEREIEELTASAKSQKAQMEERTEEKRVRVQKDEALARVMAGLERYREELAKADQASASARRAQEGTQGAREELQRLRSTLETATGESTDLEQAILQTTNEMERLKDQHEERIQVLEERRRTALTQQEGLQAKRTEEQKRLHAMQVQRLELEAEVAANRRAHEAEMAALRAQRRAVLEKGQAYDQQLEVLLAQHDADMGRRPGAWSMAGA